MLFRKKRDFSVAQRGMYRPIDAEEEQVAASFRAERVEDCKVHKKICIFAEKIRIRLLWRRRIYYGEGIWRGYGLCRD